MTLTVHGIEIVLPTGVYVVVEDKRVTVKHSQVGKVPNVNASDITASNVSGYVGMHGSGMTITPTQFEPVIDKRWG